MRGVNKVVLIGNLGRDPDVQMIEGDIPVAKFSLATTEVRKINGKVTPETEWHSVVLWRGLAELAQKYLRKGSQVYVEGKLRTRNWEDKDKIRRYHTDIIADNLIILDKKRDSNYANSNYNSEDVSLDNNNANDSINIDNSNIGNISDLDTDLQF